LVIVSGSAAGVAAASAGPPVLAFSPAPFDYGQVTVGQTPSQVFTLANTGGWASSALTVTVPGSAAFTVTADTCSGTSLGPGKSCTVTVRFAPTAAGAAGATLTAAGNKQAATATDALTGTGAPAGHLYWANFSGGTIVEANLDGTDPQTIATGQNTPYGVAVGP
jgi:Abnormal spindle-like microcephaly-assoc'd, ASPM-SPD-2-Hydin